MNIKKLMFIASIAVIAVFFSFKKGSHLPIVAIANYGPHASLNASIEGLKEELAQQGFIENKTVQYEMIDVGFDHALIPQMIEKLKQDKPQVMVVMATPVAQYAKAQIHDIPLVYNVITDPVDAGLIKNRFHAEANVTGSSDRQDLQLFLKFVKKLMPKATRIGLLYATSDSNDLALLNMMRRAAKTMNMTVVAIPVAESRDVAVRMQAFQGKVDLIYVGASGPVQPTLPVIAKESQSMGIPVFNVEGHAVKDGLAFASFGVDYKKIGSHAGQQVARILNGVSVKNIKPFEPALDDYQGYISKKLASRLGIQIPVGITQLTIVG